jgi:hypothetical protein
MKSDYESLSYCTLEVLEKIKANDYLRMTKPFKRYDPEVVDRLINKRHRMKKLRREKYERNKR